MKIVMSLLLVLSSIWMCPTSSCAINDELVLKVGYFDFPGLTYVDENGEAAGFVNDITIKTLENTDLKYTIDIYPPARFYEYLANGKIDIFNGLSSIPAVATSCFSSKIPLFPLEMRIYQINDRQPIEKKEDLVGHSVILVRGFTYKDWGAWIRDERNKVHFYEAESHEAAFKMLQRGRAEYLLNYRYIDEEVLNNINIPGLIIKPLFRWYCYFNVNMNTPNAKKILEKLERSYEDLIKSGKMRKFD